jgi:phage regulator Rha-like protein
MWTLMFPSRKEVDMENVSVVSSVSFVKPHFLEELGCDGLTSQEIADSIGMRHDNLCTLLDRLIKSNDINITESQCVEIIEKNAIGGTVRRCCYFLGVDDSKFLVTQSSTAAGRAYCRYLVNCEKALVTLFEEMSPELRYLIKIEHAQKQQQKQLTQLESTLKKTGLSVMDSTLSAPQIEALENLFSELYKVSNKDGPTVGRMKSALKAQFLNCAKSGVTYKDVPQKHFDACIGMVKQKIASFS